MNEVRIRRAVREDGAAILRVVESVHAKRVPEDLRGGEGFLLTLHALEFYAERAEQSEFFFVAEVGGEVAGFLMAYEPRVLACAGAGEDPERNAYAWLMRHGGERPVLVDQIGVRPEARDLKLAAGLYAAFAEAAAGRETWLTILHGPVMNVRSRGFFERGRGYALVREFTKEPLTFGLYRRGL